MADQASRIASATADLASAMLSGLGGFIDALSGQGDLPGLPTPLANTEKPINAVHTGDYATRHGASLSASQLRQCAERQSWQ